MMNIILEGCDCVGKTSIAQELQKLYGYEYIKRNAPRTRNEFKELFAADIKLMNTRSNLLFDRSGLSERVYAPLMRGYTPEYMDEYETTINNTVLVLVTASNEEILKRFDDEFVTRSNIPTIAKEYQKQFYNSKYKHKLLVDTTYASPRTCAQYIFKTVQNMGC
jgi:thymidylate kinase